MPPLEEMGHDQHALLWEATGVDAYNRPTVSDTYSALEVRWEEVRKEARRSDGTPVNIDVEAFLDRAVTIGSHMMLGVSVPTTGTGTFYPDGSLFEVVSYDETLDFTGRFYTRVAGLARYRDSQ